MTSQSKLLERITARPDAFNGKPIVRDIHFSVELFFSLKARGATHEKILDDYPDLEPDDIRACTAYEHAVIARDSLSAAPYPRKMSTLVSKHFRKL